MASSSSSSSSLCDKFCSLDMLAEVASATLRSLTMDFPLSKAKTKVGNTLSRRSINSCEKLSLDQIKSLSERNLIEMFSELICDEMKKKYSFQCFLIPDKCSQIFKSFGNEIRARCKMKIHLQSHINDLVAAANVTSDPEMFTAEPLHVRRKRMRDVNQKTTRKKKRIKQPPVKLKKDTNLGLYSKDFSLLKSVDHQFKKMTSNNLSLSPEVNSTFNSSVNISMKVDMIDNSVNHVSKKFKSLSYISSHSSICVSSDEQVILKGQLSENDFAISSKNNVKRKRRSRHSSVTKKKTSSTYENDLYHDDSSSYSAADRWLQVLHDHTYTSVNGKTFNCDRSSTSESNRSENKIFRDTFHLKKPDHDCIEKVPLIIPTPPFPYVYVPLLPHIALIQEIGGKFKKTNCKCTYDDITKSLHEFNYSNHMSLWLQRDNKNQFISDVDMLEPDYDYDYADYYDGVVIDNDDEDYNDDDENVVSSTTNPEEVLFEDASINETSDTKLFDSPFYVDDFMQNENLESLRAGEKKLALNCIRALRTKKKDERGPLTCQICKNKSFTAQATLMYHYRSHAGIKPFSCSICEATFTRQHSLNYHMLIHNNKSRFMCTDCGRNFRHPSHYKEHLRRHSEEPPHECTDYNFR